MLTPHTQNNINWYSAETLDIPHGMFTRYGGTSLPPYKSLNFSFSGGDKDTAVQENRNRLKRILDIDHHVSSRQIHGERIAIVEQVENDRELDGYDALITNQPGTGLLIQQADCQAILLYAPDKQVICAVHNGWRGSVLNIIAKTISLLQEHFKVNPAHLRAAISPSLGPCFGEFINYRDELPREFLRFQVKENYFDFWEISKWQLQQTGIKSANIFTTGICTACNDDFFSYRRAMRNGNGKTGRNGSIIALPGK